jgi:hypothetical protein
MDGVLCDFEKAAVEAINKQLGSPKPKFPKLAMQVIKALGRNYVEVNDIKKYDPSKVDVAAEYMYKLLEDNEDWWATLPWQPGGKRLWAYIKNFSPDILTSPMDKGGKSGSMSGKHIWVKNNLRIDPEKVHFEHDKWKKAVSKDGKRNILIDDFASKIDPWDDAGGIGILHVNAGNTIKILKLLQDLNEVP